MKKDGDSILKMSINNFIYNLKSAIFFEMLYKLVVWFIFVPINYSILNRFFQRIGLDNITNKQIIKFALSYQGLAYMSIMLVISFLSVFIEISVLTYIAKRSHSRQQVSLFEGIINSFRMFKKLPSFYTIGLVLITIITGPLAATGLYTPLVKSLSIPDYIKFQLSKHSGGKVIFVVVIIFLIILLLRWILVLPAMIIEKGPLKNAFKNSGAIFKANKGRMYLYILSWLLINYGLKIFLLGGCVGTGLFFITLAEGSLDLQGIISNFSLIIFFLGYVMISILSLPLFISFLVELYYKYRFYIIKETSFAIQDYLESRSYYKTLKKHRDGWLSVILVLFILITGTRGLTIVFQEVVKKDVEITAHRGSSMKAPENSISAITEAIIEGSNYAEIDVMTTLDDQVVLFHDNTLRRFSGSSKGIRNLNIDEVQQIDIGSKFNSEYKGETIPTLKEVLRLTKNQIKLNIELKPRKKDDKLAELVANMVTEESLEEQVIISSQSYESLQKVKDINPLIDVGLIVTFGIGDFSKMNVDFISVEYEMAKEELIYTMHALGKEVHVWTINDKKKAENAIKLGVDNIITDNVEMVQRTKQSIEDNDDANYITRFLDGITSLMKHVKI